MDFWFVKTRAFALACIAVVLLAGFVTIYVRNYQYLQHPYSSTDPAELGSEDCEKLAKQRPKIPKKDPKDYLSTFEEITRKIGSRGEETVHWQETIIKGDGTIRHSYVASKDRRTKAAKKLTELKTGKISSSQVAKLVQAINESNFFALDSWGDCRDCSFQEYTVRANGVTHTVEYARRNTRVSTLTGDCSSAAAELQHFGIALWRVIADWKH